MSKPNRRDRTRPVELLGLSGAFALFAGLVVFLSTRELVLSLLQRHAAVPDAGKPGKEHRAVSLAKELLQAQLAAPPSLEALAAAVNLSPFHFARVFRRATGMPPHTWLMQQRIARARALLQSGCLPLEVAMQLGFADQSHLSRQFKQVYGVGPGAYRSAKRGLEA